MLSSYTPRVVRSLGDFFGSYPVEVQVMLLGVRGLEPFRGIPIANPRVEIELSGALPLFPGSPFTVQQSQHSSNPNGANANFNGHVLRLRGRVHRLETIELALSIRIIDALPFKRMVGTAEHKLRLGAEESDDEDDDDATKPRKRKRRKLKPIQAKPLTAEELRDLETQGMASTASEASLDSNSATEDSDEFHDGSETLSMESRDYRDQDADGYSRRESFLSKTSSSFKASVHSTGKFIAKTLSKASSKSYREKRRKMKAMEGTLPFDASAEGTSFRKEGSFRGSFKKPVSIEKAGSISRRNSASGRAESVDVYRERSEKNQRLGLAAHEDEYRAERARRAGVFHGDERFVRRAQRHLGDTERGGGGGGPPAPPRDDAASAAGGRMSPTIPTATPTARSSRATPRRSSPPRTSAARATRRRGRGAAVDRARAGAAAIPRTEPGVSRMAVQTPAPSWTRGSRRRTTRLGSTTARGLSPSGWSAGR